MHWIICLRALYHSCGLQMLAWSKVLILMGKKLTFELSLYTVKYQPSTSTSQPLMNRTLLAFHCSSASMYYCECKQMLKTKKGWEQGYNKAISYSAKGICIYSRTSHNGPSDKWTTSLQRTNTVLQIEITIVLIHK